MSEIFTIAPLKTTKVEKINFNFNDPILVLIPKNQTYFPKNPIFKLLLITLLK